VQEETKKIFIKADLINPMADLKIIWWPLVLEWEQP